MNERLHARVTGTVQGVGFRHFTRAEAARLDLTGWVRNLSDGSVELVAEGPRDRLELLLASVRTGPPGSRVALVEPSWSDATNDFGTFGVRF